MTLTIPDPLPPYSGYQTKCSKCLCAVRGGNFVSSTDPRYEKPAKNDYIARECGACLYRWYEAPADARYTKVTYKAAGSKTVGYQGTTGEHINNLVAQIRGLKKELAEARAMLDAARHVLGPVEDVQK